MKPPPSKLLHSTSSLTSYSQLPISSPSLPPTNQWILPVPTPTRPSLAAGGFGCSCWNYFCQVENPTKPLINIEVVAHITKPEIRSSKVSNTFCFTFTVHPEALTEHLRIRKVVPATNRKPEGFLSAWKLRTCNDNPCPLVSIH